MTRTDEAIDRANLVRRLLAHFDNGTTYYAPNIHTEDATSYTDPRRFDRELDQLRRYPLWVAWSAELPNVGNFKTLELAGIPLLILRNEKGDIRAFRNACAHRAATVVPAERGCTGRRLVCPYHGWTYDLEGALVGVPCKRGFAELDMSTHSLTEVPVAERYGLVFACTDPEGEFEIEEHLAGLGPQFEAFGWANWEFAGEKTVFTRTNWKLAVDSYCELYHVPYLHGQSLPGFFGDVHELDFYGPHVRLTIPGPAIRGLEDRPEDEWSSAIFGQHIFFVYVVFPNTLIVQVGPGTSIHQVLPQTQSLTKVTDYRVIDNTVDPAVKEFAAQLLEFNFGVVEREDYPTAEGAWTSLSSGSRTELIFGRNEAALHHLHAQYDKWSDRS